MSLRLNCILLLIFTTLSLFAGKSPNFIIIFTDDQGYQDVGCFGSPSIKTPNLDRMASEGMKFTDFYVGAPVCSGSRASLMTGCYCHRVGIPGVLFPNSKIGLHPKEITIAEVLKQKGYATACIGKWHLGDRKPFLPTRQGFDYYFGIPYSNDMSISINGAKGPPLMRNEKIIEHPVDQDTITKRYTEEAIRFIVRNKNRPFFLYLAHTMPHVPLHVSENFRGVSARGLYGDVIEEIDWSVGQILTTIRALGLERNTLVVFTSDNGPWLAKGEYGGSAFPLRDGKFTWFEGGMRLPCIMWWPGKIPARSVCREIAATIDLLPTFAHLAGAKVPQDRIIDGKNIWSLLQGKKEAKSPHDAYYYYMQAVRVGRWKLHLPGSRTTVGPKRKLPLLLFDLERDIGEKHNVADKYPKVVKKLKALLEQHRKEIRRNKRPPGRILK